MIAMASGWAYIASTKLPPRPKVYIAQDLEPVPNSVARADAISKATAVAYQETSGPRSGSLSVVGQKMQAFEGPDQQALADVRTR